MNDRPQRPGPAGGRPGAVPYLVGGKDHTVLAEVARTLAADPEVDVMRVKGDPQAPSLLVVRMTPAHAQALGERLGPGVTIEPDLPLTQFDS